MLQRLVELGQGGRPQHHADDVADEDRRQMSISAPTARTGSWAIWTSRTTASPVTTDSSRHSCHATCGDPAGVRSMGRVDVDAFVLTHRDTWDRLEQLVKRRRRLTGAEVDELVELYQRVSTHLSMVRSASSDSVLVGRLSSLVARARSAVTGAHAPLWSEFTRFWTVSFPVVAYRAWRWWLATAVAFFAVVAVIGFWVAGNPEVQSALGTPEEIDQLVNHDFASYYSEHPAGSFALQVWVNNSWVAAQCIAFSVLLGMPIPLVLFQNAANLGVIGGLMFQAGKGDVLLGLLIPHGLLELTAVFLAAASGCGWAGR